MQTLQMKIRKVATSNDSPDERGMPRAVDQRVLHAVTAPKFAPLLLSHTHSERREAQIQGYSPLLALRIFIEGCCTGCRAQGFAQTRLATVNMTQHTDVKV